MGVKSKNLKIQDEELAVARSNSYKYYISHIEACGCSQSFVGLSDDIEEQCNEYCWYWNCAVDVMGIDKVLSILEEETKKGNIPAIFTMGFFYDGGGNHLRKDESKANKYMEMMINAGVKFNNRVENTKQNVVSGKEVNAIKDEDKIDIRAYDSWEFNSKYFQRELGEEFHEPIDFGESVCIEQIMSEVEAVCKQQGVPNIICGTYVYYGGLLAMKKCKAMLIMHPDPPQSYCDQLYVMDEGVMRFYFVGASKAFKEKNEYEMVMSGQGTGAIATMKTFLGFMPNEEEYNKEMAWHESVFSVFASMVSLV